MGYNVALLNVLKRQSMKSYLIIGIIFPMKLKKLIYGFDEGR